MTHHQADAASLGAYIREAREDAGLSLRQLEAMTGIGRMALSRLENGVVAEPQAADLVRLARALDLNATDVLLRAGLPIPTEAASLEVMLRTGYGVSEADLPDLKRQIEALIAQHTNMP